MNLNRKEEVLLGLGKNLTKLRKRKAISQRKLAMLAGIEVSQISRIEKGQINTTVTTLDAIATALDIPISKLFAFEIKEK